MRSVGTMAKQLATAASIGQHAFSHASVTKAYICSIAFIALSRGEVVFRNGWTRLFSAAAKNGKIGIISKNWSKAWIESLVEIAVRQEGLVDSEG